MVHTSDEAASQALWSMQRAGLLGSGRPFESMLGSSVYVLSMLYDWISQLSRYAAAES